MSEDIQPITQQEPAASSEASVAKKPRKKRSLKMRVFGALLGLFLLVLLLPLVLYIPAVQDFVCNQAVEWLNSSSDELEFRVGSVRIDFPLKLRINDVAMLDKARGDTLVSVGRLTTALDDLPINQPYFVLNDFLLQDAKVHMDSITESLGINGSLPELKVKGIEIDPMHSQLRIDALDFDSPDLSLFLGPSMPDSIEEESEPWRIAVAKVKIHDGHIGLDMSDESLGAAKSWLVKSPYFDYNHLSLSNIQLDAEKIQYDETQINCNVLSFSALEDNSGLELRHLSTGFRLEDNIASVSDLDLRLAGDGSLRGEVQLDLGN